MHTCIDYSLYMYYGYYRIIIQHATCLHPSIHPSILICNLIAIELSRQRAGSLRPSFITPSQTTSMWTGRFVFLLWAFSSSVVRLSAAGGQLVIRRITLILILMGTNHQSPPRSLGSFRHVSQPAYHHPAAPGWVWSLVWYTLIAHGQNTSPARQREP